MMLIKNFDELATSKLRKDALLIVEEGLKAIDTEKVLSKQISLEGSILTIRNQKLDLNKFRKIFIIGVGKTSCAAGKVLEEVLQDKISGGIILDTKPGDLKRIECVVGSHPLPSQTNVDATAKIVARLKSLTKGDLVLAIISGGGSSLLCNPYKLSCDEKAMIGRSLIKGGADIVETNIVRKHLSEIKGGWFAVHAYPATVVSLIFSDVPNDDLSEIASGPTVLDKTTVEDAQKIMTKYDVLKLCKLPHCELNETPKDLKYFAKVTNILMMNNKLALEAMKKQAQSLGFKGKIYDNFLQGQAKDVGRKLINGLQTNQVLIAGGETTVKVGGIGTGGRNQEFVLAAIPFLKKNQVIVSVASDGVDNRTEFAGAIADTDSKFKSKKLGLKIESYLENNDSFSFFKEMGDGVETGPLNSNVSDLILALNK